MVGVTIRFARLTGAAVGMTAMGIASILGERATPRGETA